MIPTVPRAVPVLVSEADKVWTVFPLESSLVPLPNWVLNWIQVSTGAVNITADRSRRLSR
jgi:hypothetical protein